MATIKSFTDLSQSKVIAEILPHKTADMYYTPPLIKGHTDYIPHLKRKLPIDWDIEQAIPCWSLAALFNVLPNSIYDNTDEYSQLEFSKISVAYHDMNDGIKVGSIKDNLVDACYEMIIKLHELNLL